MFAAGDGSYRLGIIICLHFACWFVELVVVQLVFVANVVLVGGTHGSQVLALQSGNVLVETRAA